MSKRQGMQTFRRETDRFWVLAVHPTQNLLGAGHDAGLIVFKLERERPAYVPLGETLLFIKDRSVRAHDYATGKDSLILSIRRAAPGGAAAASAASNVVRSIHYNEAESMLLVCTDAEGGTYELYAVPRPGGGAPNAPATADGGECKRGLGTSGVFVARQRFAVLDKTRQILIKNFQNEVTKKLAPLYPNTDALFPAATGTLLVRADDRLTLFDIQQRKALGELTTACVKYVVWSADGSHVALLSKHAVVLADKKLTHLATMHETIRLKSGVRRPARRRRLAPRAEPARARAARVPNLPLTRTPPPFPPTLPPPRCTLARAGLGRQRRFRLLDP
jgi:coatomer protein complex subunit alpha (xenin)